MLERARVFRTSSKRFAARVAIVALSVFAFASPAFAVSDYAYNLLMAHKSDIADEQAAAGARCRNEPDVQRRLTWLGEDEALAKVAYESLMALQTKVSAEWETSLETDKRQGKYDSFNGTGSGKSNALHGELDQITKMIDEVEARRQADLKEIEALNSKPLCKDVPPPPPPPPPPPAPPPFPPAGPGGGISTRQPHHRYTNCAPCKDLADLLNETIDEYLDAQKAGRKAGLGLLETRIDTYARALNGCERRCAVPGTQHVMRGPPVKHSHPHHAVSEDNPEIMEGVKPLKQTSHPSSGGSQPYNGPTTLPEKPHEPEDDHAPDHKVPMPDNPYQPDNPYVPH